MTGEAEIMCGCDACGAQVRRDDASCPICGADLRPGAAKRPHIPIRRFGTVPPLAEELEESLDEEEGGSAPRRIRSARPPRYAAYLLAVASAVALAACASLWLR